jgi:amino acid permease
VVNGVFVATFAIECGGYDVGRVIGRTPSGGQLLFILGMILFLAWIGGFGVLHVTSYVIHVLVVLAVISVLLHFVRGKRGRK